jgi:TPR repeat protein
VRIALLVCMVACLALGCGELGELRLRARLGDSGAQFRLAERLEKGDGIAADPARAARWYRAAAAQGRAPAQVELAQEARGYLLATGQGTPEDPAAAARWYRAAAEQGSPLAQHYLGHLYRTGRGVPRDAERARRWSERAARQGYAPACRRLGYAYYWGEGLPRDFVLSHAWFRASGESLEASGMLKRLFVLLTEDERARAERLARRLVHGL